MSLRILCFRWDMYRDTDHLALDKFQHPGVAVYCLHGVNISTPLAYSYAPDSFPDSQPTAVNGDGDGTVNLRSLHRCLEWGRNHKHSFFHKEFTGTLAEHLRILENPSVIDLIMDVLNS